MGTVVLAAIAVALLVRFANEKFFLVMALLCWVYLVAWVLRQALGLPPTARHPATPEAQDPIALNFFGVDRGFQSFGIYLHGVRVGNDPINNDTR